MLYLQIPFFFLFNKVTELSQVSHQYALKGQKPLAQGNALGNDGCKPVAL